MSTIPTLPALPSQFVVYTVFCFLFAAFYDISNRHRPKELFEIVESRNIIAFIKDINFYNCI